MNHFIVCNHSKVPCFTSDSFDSALEFLKGIYGTVIDVEAIKVDGVPCRFVRCESTNNLPELAASTIRSFYIFEAPHY